MINYDLQYILRECGQGYKIYLKYTINKVRKYKSTGWVVKEKQWDTKAEKVRDTHLDYEAINNDLAARKQAFISELLTAQLTGKRSINTAKIGYSVYSFVEDWLKEIAHKRRPATIKNNLKHLRKLKRFAGPDLTFEDMDTDFLRRYEAEVRKTFNKENSTFPAIVWTILKVWFNAARKRGVTTCYPFDQYENPTYNPDEKEYLTLEELDKWEKYAESATGATKQVAVYFLLGCYSGLRVSDWYKFSIKNVHKGEIRLRATKNKTWLAIPIHKRLEKVIDLIRVTPLTVTDVFINTELKKIAKELKINKRISTHSGRKTMAVTLCANQGISSETCAEILGITIASCVKAYYRVTSDKIKNETSRAWAGL